MYKYFFILLLILVSCSDAERKEYNRKQDSLLSADVPDQTIKQMKVRFVDSSYTKAVLIGDLGRVFTLRNQTLLNGNIRVEFFSKLSGKRISYLTADSVIIDDITKNMMGMGNVVVVSDSTGAKLQTTVLQWLNSERKLYSNEFVKITSPRENMQGYGFESDEGLNNYKIYKVTGDRK